MFTRFKRAVGLLAGCAVVAGVMTFTPVSGLVTQAQAATLNYVALGDSFSASAGTSAPGNAPSWWRSTTPGYDAPDVGTYMGTASSTWEAPFVLGSKRNYQAWPVLLANKLGANLVDFRASTGAVMKNVTMSAQADRTQHEQLWNFRYKWGVPDATGTPTDQAKSVNLVTITIGGNDVGFGDFVRSCIGLLPCDQNLINTAKSKLTDSVVNLSSTYTAILNTFPNATVWVVGYPHADPPGINPWSSGSWSWNEKPNALSWDTENADRIGAFTDVVNTTIRDTVIAMANPRLKYVEISRDDFPGYYARSSAPGSYFVDILPGAFSMSAGAGAHGNESMAHPNYAGQVAIANAVAKAINGTNRCPAYAMPDPVIRAKHDANFPAACATSAVRTAVTPSSANGWNGGMRQDFAGGISIVRNTSDSGSTTPAYLLYGATGAYALANIGYTGFPITDEYAWAGGRRQDFQKLTEVYTPATGMHLLYGATGGYIMANITATGFPATDEYAWAGGRAQTTANGRVVWSQATGVHYLSGAHGIGTYIVNNIGSTGLPTSDEYAVRGGWAQNTTYATVYYNAASGYVGTSASTMYFANQVCILVPSLCVV